MVPPNLHNRHHTIPCTSHADAHASSLSRVYAWFTAIASNDTALLEDLNLHGLPVDVLHPLRHTTALMESTRLGRTATVAWLLQRGASAGLLSGMPQGSALHCALRRRHWEIAALLLGQMDDAALVDAYGATPLHALCVGMLTPCDLAMAKDMARMLLDKGCPPNALDHEGVTALHHCIIQDMPEMAELLLSRSACPNALTPDTLVSPLMIAALERNAPLVQLLLRHGGDPHLPNRKGVAPVQVYPAINKLLTA